MKTKHDFTQGEASWAKMMSLGGKLTALVSHSTKYVKKKAEKPTYLSKNLAFLDKGRRYRNFSRVTASGNFSSVGLVGGLIMIF